MQDDLSDVTKACFSQILSQFEVCICKTFSNTGLEVNFVDLCFYAVDFTQLLCILILTQVDFVDFFHLRQTTLINCKAVKQETKNLVHKHK